MRTLKNKAYAELLKSKKLQEIASDEKTPFQKAQEIRQQQNLSYGKYLFLKKLNEILEKSKEKKNER